VRTLVSACCFWLVIATSASAQDAQAGLARLKSALHLSAQQMQAWNTYQAGMAPDPQVQAREVAARRMLAQLTTPRRLALIEAAMEDHLADFRKRSARITDFYGQLTPDQQRIFDQQTAPPASRGTGD
jgi:protein CpxP